MMTEKEENKQELKKEVETLKKDKEILHAKIAKEKAIASAKIATEKAKAYSGRFKNEFNKSLNTAIVAAFAFIIGLAWKDMVTE